MRFTVTLAAGAKTSDFRLQTPPPITAVTNSPSETATGPSHLSRLLSVWLVLRKLHETDGANMPLKGILDPGQLDILTAVLTEYCRRHSIVEESDRNDAAQRAMVLYDRGCRSPNELLALLDRDDD